MSIKKKIALFTCFYSFNSIMFSQCSYSMDSNYYSFNNYCQVLQKHYNSNKTKIIRKLSHNCFVFEYEGTNFVLKPMSCPNSFESESLACETFKNKKYSLISPPINCFCDELSSDEKMFSIYRYEQNISDQKLFNFINYSDYCKSNPSQIRDFAERKEIWNNIANKIITIINILWENKLIHNDMQMKNLMFSINYNKLDVKLIDFDSCCSHDQFINGDVRGNAVMTSWIVVFQDLISSLCCIFLGKQYYGFI